MPYSVIVKEEARLDMIEAYQYYEQKQTALGERFLSELQKRLTAISEHPEFYSYIDSQQILRDVKIDYFPYVIVYAIMEQEIRVYAIHLTHKHPEKKYRG